MKIGIIGVGSIGKTLALRLSGAGHEVKVANSRGPGTISGDILKNNVRAVTAEQVVVNVDVVITSTPFMSIINTRPLLSCVSDETTIIDTSNYYPHRGDEIDKINNGQAESAWVSEYLGRPIAKAWNSIISASFDANARLVGAPGRIALPVAADRENDLEVAMTLVETTGFDAVYTGKLEDSWRQHPGAPCYCTDLNRAELLKALAATDKSRLPKRRELMIAAMKERYGQTMAGEMEPTVRLMRALFL